MADTYEIANNISSGFSVLISRCNKERSLSLSLSLFLYQDTERHKQMKLATHWLEGTGFAFTKSISISISIGSYFQPSRYKTFLDHDLPLRPHCFKQVSLSLKRNCHPRKLYDVFWKQAVCSIRSYSREFHQCLLLR